MSGFIYSPLLSELVSDSLSFLALILTLFALFALSVLIGVLLLRLLAVLRRKDTNDQLPDEQGFPLGSPFISVHVPICSEPPAMVIATLRSILRQNYLNFEVIVVDNNTADPAAWLPVEQFCRESGPQFIFKHFDVLAGHKAGALNQALRLTSAQARVVMVVDADYQLLPDALATAAGAFRSDDSFVQFPQSYRNVDAATRGAAAELNGFFEFFAPAAGRSVLPTGTLTCFRMAALEQIGGWPTSSITEDALTGIILQSKGLSGRYIPQVIGSGLIPSELCSAHKQRHRWVAGNAQVLLYVACNHFSLLRIPVLVQLTAWWSGYSVYCVSLILLAILPVTPAVVLLSYIVAAAIFLELAVSILKFSRCSGVATSVKLSGLLSYLRLSPVSSTAIIDGILKADLPFTRTSKSVNPSGQFAEESINNLFFAVSLLVSTVVMFGQKNLDWGIAAALMVFTFWLLPRLDVSVHKLESLVEKNKSGLALDN